MASAATNDSSIDFGVAPTEATSGVFKRNATSSDTYPVYYYRGIVDNNNVLFDGFCWKIVRTTETAGIKLIYNGVAAANGSCNNTGTANQLPNKSKFNYFGTTYSLLADVGYMFGTRYEYATQSMSDQNGTFIYANDVSYSNGIYTLIDPIESTNWSTDRTTIDSKYHYTCFQSSATCEGSVYYIFGGDSSSAKYFTLNGEQNIEVLKQKMFANENDSTIKGVIDDWYENNLIDKESFLEDAIWCNDRRITSGSLASKDSSYTGQSNFGARDRLMQAPYNVSFTCDKNDAFTKNESAIGNGALDNPVGMLTADEYTLAGNGYYGGYSNSTYLYTGESQWTMSPNYFIGGSAGFILQGGSSGYLNSFPFTIEYGVRPAVSLKPGTKVTGEGDGSVGKPFSIE